jgi:tetratricopeptide (TPR) repeat protein
VEHLPRHVGIRDRLGNIHWRRKEWREAETCFRAAVRLAPGNAVLVNRLAFLLADCPDESIRRPVEAVALAVKATELAPETWQIWHTLGVARYRAGAYEDAEKALRKAAEVGGDEYGDWFTPAMVRWRLGDREKARELFDRGVERLRTNPPADTPNLEELERLRAEAAELLEGS